MHIDGDRITLRPVSRDDLAGFVAMHDDDEVSAFVGRPDEQSAVEWLRNAERDWEVRGFGVFGIHERAIGRFVGRCGLIHWPDSGETELGWALRRDAWGRGLATEACRLTIDWAFAETGITRLTASIAPDNKRSHAVAERLGMTWSHHTAYGDREVDVYEITRPPLRTGSRGGRTHRIGPGV